MSTRLFVSAPFSNADELVLDGEQARYLGRVLRLTTGDRIGVFNSDAGEWQAEITALSKSTVTLRLLEQVPVVVESPLRTHLVQGISRGERMDFVVQKATELGVKRITPVLTDHGMVKLDAARAAKRQQHWQRIAESACEQSGRIRPPLIDAPLSLNSWFGAGTSAGSTQLVLHPGATSSLGSINTVEKKICFLVGPEGGLSEREYDDAAVAGFTAVALGPRVLRTETAALAALAIAQALWGDLRET
jgi:16S rRNA (uracil1498-N3)-methyltransferase